MNSPKIAIVHDDLVQYGGAERVVEVMHEIWPDAPIYTTIYDEANMQARGWDASTMDVRTSHYQWLPNKASWANKIYLPIFPMAVESLDLSEFEIVISSTARFAQGIITKPDTLHICYMNSPARFLWMFPEYEKQHGRINGLQRLFLMPILHYLRIWDQLAAKRPDVMIGNSNTIKSRIEKYHRRDAAVIHPPVEVVKFTPKEEIESGDYFVLVSRLAGHKRVDIAVDAFNQLGSKYKLKIIGDGDKREQLEKNAGSNIEFLGFAPDNEKIKVVQTAKAFLYPQVEDYGITAVEANAAGIPVIGYRKGGLLDTTVEGKTAMYFDEQTPESLAEAIRNFNSENYDPEDCMNQADEFSKANFTKKLTDFVDKEYEKFNK